MFKVAIPELYSPFLLFLVDCVIFARNRGTVAQTRHRNARAINLPGERDEGAKLAGQIDEALPIVWIVNLGRIYHFPEVRKIFLRREIERASKRDASFGE